MTTTTTDSDKFRSEKLTYSDTEKYNVQVAVTSNVYDQEDTVMIVF